MILEPVEWSVDLVELLRSMALGGGRGGETEDLRGDRYGEVIVAHDLSSQLTNELLVRRMSSRVEDSIDV